MKQITANQNQNRSDGCRHAKICLQWLLIIMVWFGASGCSILVAKPPTAHVQIDGLNHQIGEFVVALNPTDQQQLDIHLGRQYALRLDFRWLWDQDRGSSQFYVQQDPDDFQAPLTPWMTCKYRF